MSRSSLHYEKSLLKYSVQYLFRINTQNIYEIKYQIRPKSKLSNNPKTNQGWKQLCISWYISLSSYASHIRRHSLETYHRQRERNFPSDQMRKSISAPIYDYNYNAAVHWLLYSYTPLIIVIHFFSSPLLTMYNVEIGRFVFLSHSFYTIESHNQFLSLYICVNEFCVHTFIVKRQWHQNALRCSFS